MRQLSFRLATIAGLLFALITNQHAHADERTLVEFPAPMQEHMLSNMRSHLRALDEILANLAVGNTQAAGLVAEQQLGLGSLDDHGAAHLAAMMPQPMQDIGTEMHKAASRFAQTAQDAEVEQSYAAQQKVFGALQGILVQCNACHSGYRLR
ncbi:MAG TPA: hypothetical protein VIN57_02330 [Magnetovibrio sp.]